MLRSLLALVLLAHAAVAQTRHRAILISFDGFSEDVARMFIDSVNTPTLWSMFRTAACAERVRPAFVSVTPAGHAAIWTGVYGNVNGIAGIANGALPLPSTTILETTDGYRAPQLSAEPIWIAAARQGKRAFSQMATQSPGPPGYPPAIESGRELNTVRARATANSQSWSLAAVNVYNERVVEAQVITEATHAPQETRAWRGLASLGAKGPLTMREISWPFGSAGDSLHALFVRSPNGVSGVVVSTTRDASRGVFARPASVDTTRPVKRPLARHFTQGLRVDLPGGRRTFVFARLFDLSLDLSRFSLFISEGRVTQGNRPDVAREYDARVGGAPGNGAYHVLEQGGFGPTIDKGGDGSAELRYLETSELLTRQYMAGTEMGRARWAPDLHIDYLPYPDEALHMWYAFAHPSTPGVDPRVRALATQLLKRVYQLIDRRALVMRRIADASPGTMLFITGEHGMRPTWASFHANVLLRQAGLLATDSAGRINLSRTLAAATRGGWITVNQVLRRGGIVRRDSVDAVLTRVEQALRSARDSTGAPIVTQIWRATSSGADTLGLDGPAGGDLYFALAPGLFPEADTRGAVVNPRPLPRGEHGFPSVERDMQPALCVFGPGVKAHRFGVVRQIDIAPTISEWLGITPPANSRGRSRLSEIVR